MSNLEDIDEKVLEEVDSPGSVPDLVWGAAVSISVEFLQARGFLTRSPSPALTSTGRMKLAEMRAARVCALA